MQVADYQLTVERNIFHVSSPHPRRDCRLAGPRLCTAAPATVMSGPGRPPPPPGHSGLGPVCPSSTGHNNLSGVKHLCSHIFTDCVLTWPSTVDTVVTSITTEKIQSRHERESVPLARLSLSPSSAPVVVRQVSRS